MRALTLLALLLAAGCEEGNDHLEGAAPPSAGGGTGGGGTGGGGGGTGGGTVPTSSGTPPDVWDSDMPGSTTYHTPPMASGQLYWRLVEARYYPPGQSSSVGGDHHIYFQAKGLDGRLLEGQSGLALLYDNALYAATKGAADHYRGDIPMFGTGWCTSDIDTNPGPYSFRMVQDNLPSTRVDGMGLHCNHHMTWWLVFQKTVAP
jgi:hypothetical protein